MGACSIPKGVPFGGSTKKKPKSAERCSWASVTPISLGSIFPRTVVNDQYALYFDFLRNRQTFTARKQKWILLAKKWGVTEFPQNWCVRGHVKIDWLSWQNVKLSTMFMLFELCVLCHWIYICRIAPFSTTEGAAPVPCLSHVADSWLPLLPGHGSEQHANHHELPGEFLSSADVSKSCSKDLILKTPDLTF